MDELLQKAQQANQATPPSPTTTGAGSPSLEGFQSFIMKKYPQMAKGNLTSLQDFVSNQQQSKLVESGNAPFADLAKNSPSTALALINKGFKPEAVPTADQKNREIALKPAEAAINAIPAEDLKLFGQHNRIARVLIDNFGGWGVDQRVVSADQSLELMKQNVVRALQGARMSDTDIKVAGKYIPSITDIPETAKTKLNNLKSFINSMKTSHPNSSQTDPSGRPSLDSFNTQ